MTPQQKLDAAYNEFVRDYCDGHEQNAATRNEAHDEADKLVALGKAIGEAVKVFGSDVGHAEDMLSATDLNPDELSLAFSAAYVVMADA